MGVIMKSSKVQEPQGPCTYLKLQNDFYVGIFCKLGTWDFINTVRS